MTKVKKKYKKFLTKVKQEDISISALFLDKIKPMEIVGIGGAFIEGYLVYYSHVDGSRIPPEFVKKKDINFYLDNKDFANTN